MTAARAALSHCVVIAVAFWAGLAVGHRPTPAQREPEKLRSDSASLPVSGLAKRDQAETSADWIEPAPSDQPLSVPLQRLRAIADLNTVLSNKIWVSLLSGEGLDLDFIAVYGLSATEVAKLEDEVRLAKAALAELDARFATIEPDGAGGHIISIPPFPSEGGAVHDRLLNGIRTVLGEERYSMFSQISHFERSTEFDKFGLARTEIRVRPPGGPDGASSSGRMNPDQEGGGMTLTIETSLKYLKFKYPLLHAKLTATD